MKISLNKIKQYVDIPRSISDQELIQLIGSRLVEVEEVIDLASKYRHIYIVKVISTEPIPDTHLSLCQIDAGPHTSEYSDSETIQVVCGAPNVHAGMFAAWIAPGAIVPSTFGNENFRLSVRKLRGYDSNGMLAAADELDLGTDHAGIIEIDPKSAFPGDDFATIFDLNDLILDVENKSLTHRPDCFGLIGFAREVAGILGVKFQEPAYPKLALSQTLPIQVSVDPELCPRYDCAVFDLPKFAPEKYFTKTAAFLAKSGMRSIDPMVDLTNILMLETGQPLHAFDYDKFVALSGQKTPKIIVRSAKPDETIQLLDGKTVTCTPDDILVTSNNIPVALAGAMGGKNTEIDVSTKRVILESATFSLYHLRKTQMAHGIFSEAITRFTKGQPATMTFAVLAEAIQRLGVEPLAVVDEYPQKAHPALVQLTTQEINHLLGTTYSLAQIQTTLENVGFTVSIAPSQPSETKTAVIPSSDSNSSENASLKVVAPLWRTDIHLKEDIIEEVGRLLGYDNIPLTLPTHLFLEAEIDPIFRFKSQIRAILSDQIRLHEVLTYSFVSRQLLEKVNLDPTESYEIVNSISPELQCFRQQIIPSILDKVRENLKAGYRNFGLYELNQVSQKSLGLTTEGTPNLSTHLGLISLGDFYQVKAEVIALFRELKLPFEYAKLTPNSAAAKKYPYFEPAHSAVITYQGEVLGVFGEIRRPVLAKFKLDQTVSACEINLNLLLNLPHLQPEAFVYSKFPAVERDLTIKVTTQLDFGRIYNTLDEVLKTQNLIFSVAPLSIYQATPQDSTKNLSFHLKFAHPDRTLDSNAISAIMEQITVAMSGLSAEII